MRRFLLVLLMITSLPAIARDGTEISGGGGNGAVAEFRRLGMDALGNLANHGGTDLVYKFNAAKALETFATAKLEATKKSLRLRGKEVTAINYPGKNKIVFAEKDWERLDRISKLQLVLHEVIGLTHRGIIDDGNYLASKELLELAMQSTVENVALALAQANYFYGKKPIVQTKRTKVIGPYQRPGIEDGQITEVYVQTFENSSDSAVRIYWIYEDETGAVVKADLVNSEGPVGP